MLIHGKQVPEPKENLPKWIEVGTRRIIRVVKEKN